MSVELTVRLREDRPGELSRVVEALGRAGVNLEGVAEQDGVVHLLVADVAGAKGALEAAGLAIESEREPLLVPLEDRPGTLAAITSKLAARGINLHHVYLATGLRIVIGVDDVAAAQRALSEAPTRTQSLPARPQSTQTLPTRKT